MAWSKDVGIIRGVLQESKKKKKVTKRTAASVYHRDYEKTKNKAYRKYDPRKHQQLSEEEGEQNVRITSGPNKGVFGVLRFTDDGSEIVRNVAGKEYVYNADDNPYVPVKDIDDESYMESFGAGLKAAFTSAGQGLKDAVATAGQAGREMQMITKLAPYIKTMSRDIASLGGKLDPTLFNAVTGANVADVADRDDIDHQTEPTLADPDAIPDTSPLQDEPEGRPVADLPPLEFSVDRVKDTGDVDKEEISRTVPAQFRTTTKPKARPGEHGMELQFSSFVSSTANFVTEGVWDFLKGAGPALVKGIGTTAKNSVAAGRQASADVKVRETNKRVSDLVYKIVKELRTYKGDKDQLIDALSREFGGRSADQIKRILKHNIDKNA